MIEVLSVVAPGPLGNVLSVAYGRTFRGRAADKFRDSGLKECEDEVKSWLFRFLVGWLPFAICCATFRPGGILCRSDQERQGRGESNGLGFFAHSRTAASSCHLDRLRRSNAPEEEWRDPEHAS